MTHAESDRVTALTDFGFGCRIAFDPRGIALLTVAHLAIAAAANTAPISYTHAVATARSVIRQPDVSFDLDRYVESLTDRTPAWIEQLSVLASTISESRRVMIGVSLATMPLYTSISAFEQPVTVRRIDAVLDLLDVKQSAESLQTVVSDMALDIQGGPPEDTTRDFARAARPVADLLTWVHPIVGFTAQTALGHLADGPAPRAAFDASAVTLARVVCAHELSCSSSGGNGEGWRVSAEHSRALLLTELRDTLLLARRADKGRRTILVRGVGRVAQAAKKLTDLTEPANALPDLTGLYMAEARRICSAAGLDLSAAADARNGQLPDDRWVVTAEPPVFTGGSVTLSVRRATEIAPSGMLATATTAACEFVGNSTLDDLDRVWLALRELLPADSPVVAYANAMGSSIAITETDLWIFNRDELHQLGKVRQRIPRDIVSDVEAGKHWLDWFIRIHTGDVLAQPSRLNFAGSEFTARRLRSIILHLPA